MISRSGWSLLGILTNSPCQRGRSGHTGRLLKSVSRRLSRLPFRPANTHIPLVKDLVDYWKTDFDWRKHERILNEKLPQFMTSIATEDPSYGTMRVHFAHVRSSRPHAIPLLVCHGWPGHFAEVCEGPSHSISSAEPSCSGIGPQNDRWVDGADRPEASGIPCCLSFVSPYALF